MSWDAGKTFHSAAKSLCKTALRGVSHQGIFVTPVVKLWKGSLSKTTKRCWPTSPRPLPATSTWSNRLPAVWKNAGGDNLAKANFSEVKRVLRRMGASHGSLRKNAGKQALNKQPGSCRSFFGEIPWLQPSAESTGGIQV